MSKDEVAFPIADTVESELPADWKRIEDPDNGARITLDRITEMTLFGVCGWSLIETPWEIGSWSQNIWLLALAVSKLVVILTGTGAIARVRVARAIFAIICGASVLAIAPALPFMYARSVEIAAISTVECALKAMCLGALCLSSLQIKRRNRRSGSVDLGMR